MCDSGFGLGWGGGGLRWGLGNYIFVKFDRLISFMEMVVGDNIIYGNFLLVGWLGNNGRFEFVCLE